MALVDLSLGQVRLRKLSLKTLQLSCLSDSIEVPSALNLGVIGKFSATRRIKTQQFM